MMADHTIVMLYGPAWDAPSRMSKHHLARYLSQTRPVLYVEFPANPLSFIRRPDEALRALWRNLTGPSRCTDTLQIQSYLCPLPYRGRKLMLGARWVNSVNQSVISPQLRRLLRRLGFERPIVVAGAAHALPLIDALQPTLLVYHCSDDYTRQDDFPESFASLERDFIQRCDFVIATSEELHRAKAHMHANIHTVPNGAEVEHFASTQDPATTCAEDLATLPRPMAGYIGTIFRWIDQDMIVSAARRLPAWSFVLVGPVMTDVRRLRALPNVHLVGPRPYQVLPRYLKGLDVAMVPFVSHDVTLRASPIKFYEYLASGVPIVATRLPDLEPFAHLASLVTSPGEFAAAVEHAPQHNTPLARQVRMSEARAHSWESRFDRIERLIAEGLREKAVHPAAT